MSETPEDWPFEAQLLVTRLRRAAAHYRQMAEASMADSEKGTPWGFARGQASAFRICAESVERHLEWADAKERVHDMLLASLAEGRP